MVEKVRSRLSSWKRRNLSFGGRIVLIKAALFSLPLYYMSIFKMPNCVIKSIESIQARFLWGGFDLKKKIHLVAWSKLSNSKLCGGLGIRNIKLMNECLLMKWWWRFGMEKSALWRKVLNAKYKIEGRDWIPTVELNRKVSKTWRDIMLICVRQPLLFEAFIENAKLRIGDGRSIMFWKDIWLGNIPLQSLFPTLFRILSNKSETLAGFFCLEDPCWIGNQKHLQSSRRYWMVLKWWPHQIGRIS